MRAALSVATDSTAGSYAFVPSTLAGQGQLSPAPRLAGVALQKPPKWSTEMLGFPRPYPLISLYGDIGSGWKLARPLTLKLQHEWVNSESQYSIHDSEFHVYGVGSSAAEAIDELVSMLLDLYHELVDSEDVLGPHLQQQLARLRSFLVEH